MKWAYMINNHGHVQSCNVYLYALLNRKGKDEKRIGRAQYQSFISVDAALYHSTINNLRIFGM